MSSSTIAQRQKAALATLDFSDGCWKFIESPDVPTDGHDACGRYVEEFWLPVLGPTCVVILRYLADSLQHHGSFAIALQDLPHRFGLGRGHAANSLFGRSIVRLVAFELVEVAGPRTLLVRTVVPRLSASQVAHLHCGLQMRHRSWVKNALP